MARSRLYLGTALAIVIAASPGGMLQSPHAAYAQENQAQGVEGTGEAVDCAANPSAEGCADTSAPVVEAPAAEENPAQEPAPEQEAVEQPVSEQPAENQADTAPAPAEGESGVAQESDGQTAEPVTEQAPQEAPAEQTAEEPAQSEQEQPQAGEAPSQPSAESSSEAPSEPAAESGQGEGATEAAKEQPAAESEAPASDTAESDGQGKTAPEGESSASESGTAGDAAEAPQPSADAPEPKAVAEEPIEEQIEKAEETQTAVVPEEITDEQRQKLKKAEKNRREKARERREELLGAAAAGAVVGALIPILGGKVVEDEGDRFVVERNGEYIVRRDDSALFRHNAEQVEIEHLPRGRTRETVYRSDGSRIVTLRDAGGYVLMRKRIRRDGQEIVLFDAFEERREFVDYDRTLPPVQITIPRDEYIVPARRHGRRQLAEIFAAPPVEALPERYTLREVRESERLRQYVRRVDLDTVTFDSGSYYVSESQVPYLADIAGGMLDVIDENPGAVFLVEGHTDAVGPELSNLTLSDRRSETVARILVEAYGVPPENLVVEGYGEQFLKIDTQGDERQNRRVTIRNISPLLQTANN